MVVWVGQCVCVCVWGGRAKIIGSDFRTKIHINYVQRTTYQVEARLPVSTRGFICPFVIMPSAATRQHTLYFYYVYAQIFVCKYICVDVHQHHHLSLYPGMPAYGVKWLNFRRGTTNNGSSLKWKFIFYYWNSQTSRTLTGLDFCCYCCCCCWRTQFSWGWLTRFYTLCHVYDSHCRSISMHTTSQDWVLYWLQFTTSRIMIF